MIKENHNYMYAKGASSYKNATDAVGGGIRPPSKLQLNQAKQIATDLLDAFHEVMELLPEHARGASGMSRYLSVARTTCQRIVSALRETTRSAATLIDVPGSQGMRQLLDAIQQAHGESAVLQKARQRVTEFDRFIRNLGGSQSKLRERLELQADQYDSEKGISDNARQRLFEAAVSVTGRECDVLLNLYVFRPQEDNPDQMECATAHGMIGNVVRSAGMPIYLTMGRVHSASITSSDFMMLEQGTHSILPEFCSKPEPILNMNPSGKDHVLYVFDRDKYEDGEVIDIVFAGRTSDPMIDPDTGCYSLDSVWALMNCPSRHQILDVYIHRDIERLFRPNVEAQLWNPKLDQPAEHRWITRLPIHPQLQLLGEGLERAACPSYPRHADLTRHLFNVLHWRTEEFIGFRCEMAFPIWRSGICMYFTPIKMPT